VTDSAEAALGSGPARRCHQAPASHRFCISPREAAMRACPSGSSAASTKYADAPRPLTRCARAARGQAAAPETRTINFRRLIGPSRAGWLHRIPHLAQCVLRIAAPQLCRAIETAMGQVEPPAAYPPTYAGASAVPGIADSVDPQVKVVKVIGLVPLTAVGEIAKVCSEDDHTLTSPVRESGGLQACSRAGEPR